MKIAIITSGDLSDMKGVMNYVHEKAKHMQCVAGIECDVYLIRQMPSPLFQLLTQRTIPEVAKYYFTKRQEKTVFDMVQYHNLWYHYGVHTNIITTKIRKAIEYIIAINELQQWTTELDGEDIDGIIRDIDVYYKLEMNMNVEDTAEI